MNAIVEQEVVQPSCIGKRDPRKDEYMPDPLEESIAEDAANRQIEHDEVSQ